MADITTTEGRAQAKQAMKGYAFMGDYIRALDGLDIAQEMAADLELHDPNSPALAKWDKWQA